MAPEVRPVRDKVRNLYFPIVADLEFTLLARATRITGHGRTVTVSSRRLVFNSTESLPVGVKITFGISWPVRLHGKICLKLCGWGTLIHYESGLAEVEFAGYEFRTSPKTGDKRLTI